MNAFAITCGDVNGIGPEIVIKSLNKGLLSRNRSIIFICPQNIFESTIKYIKPNFNYQVITKIPEVIKSDRVYLLNIGYCRQTLGRETKSSGITSYNSIIKACELVKDNLVDGIITAPISKLAFSKAGIDFTGHTELLANYFKVRNYVMMFLSNKMKSGLATIHIPIKDVSKSITKKNLLNTIKIIEQSLINDFHISAPKIAVLGLNPHSGEEGLIGIEEKKIIKPVIKQYSNTVFGPMIPDAYFATKAYKKYDCTIGLYHDQLLIPFKLLSFDKGVNFTAGLPIVRTSPDHGTAFNIAGKGIANEKSTIEAFKFAEKIVKNRKRKLAAS